MAAINKQLNVANADDAFEQFWAGHGAPTIKRDQVGTLTVPLQRIHDAIQSDEELWQQYAKHWLRNQFDLTGFDGFFTELIVLADAFRIHSIALAYREKGLSFLDLVLFLGMEGDIPQ